MTRRLASMAAALMLIAGCVLPVKGVRSGRELPRGIVPGAVTKASLIASLGPPMAIAAAGEYVDVPAANVYHWDDSGGGTRWFGGGSYVQQADAWLELFAARRVLSENHRVYYWYSSAASGARVWVPLPLFVVLSTSVVRRSQSFAELWVLVDEETGRVDDAVYRSR